MRGVLIYPAAEAERNRAVVKRYLSFFEGALSLVLREELPTDATQAAAALAERFSARFALVRAMEPALSAALERRGVRVFNRAAVSLLANDKRNTYLAAARAGILHLPTVFDTPAGPLLLRGDGAAGAVASQPLHRAAPTGTAPCSAAARRAGAGACPAAEVDGEAGARIAAPLPPDEAPYRPDRPCSAVEIGGPTSGMDETAPLPAAAADECARGGTAERYLPPELRSAAAVCEGTTGPLFPAAEVWVPSGDSHAAARAAAEFGFPLVVKPAHGRGGRGVTLACSLAEALRAAAAFAPDPPLFQPLVGERGVDVRVYLLAGRPLAAMKRISNGDFRSNFSLSGRAERYALTGAQAELLRRVCALAPFDYAGADFLLRDGAFVLNELEDVVGARMLYTLTKLDPVRLYCEHIRRELAKEL